ncbi:aminoglycoside phosphotransferase family protein [Schnuerera sp. xch1]|uniref:aminoglycoside phosphotransferase family protein n=1 Tax=Schnuerera sp. xch1 TaxID=2874283 RepID=UPI001CBAE39D|nr:aminoglycoside phosphotransferase family protein [Schnuerera sp. xch1]MBZ2174678.1 aminoglycoside phosphotransferase family protein [Schnuerera sp. xch1]
MNPLIQFPKSIYEFLIDSFGEPLLITKLNGIKAEGGCYRVGFSNHSIIVKQMTKPQEYLFYYKCSSLLKEFRKNIPSLYWSYKDENKYWIVIEDIPYALPKERWHQADEQVLRALFLFHTESLGKSLPIDNSYIPKWDHRLTESVLAFYSDKTGNQLQPLLIKAQEDSQQLFKPYCWINADTNPTNWGVRKDGSVVLFDWERISCGSPAIDLSIIMPGLGTPDNFLELSIAKKYLKMWSSAGLDFPFSEWKLLQQIKLAKIWSVVEFLDNNADTLDADTLLEILSGLAEKLYMLC